MLDPQILYGHLPHNQAFGSEELSIGEGRAEIVLRYREELIGDPDTGVVSGGVITTLFDNVCGRSVYAALKERTSVATLDLRIDYMRPAPAGMDLYASGHVYKLTRSIAFVRAIVHVGDPEDPVAAAQAAFMLDSNGGRTAGANLRAMGQGAKEEGR